MCYFDVLQASCSSESGELHQEGFRIFVLAFLKRKLLPVRHQAKSNSCMMEAVTASYECVCSESRSNFLLNKRLKTVNDQRH